MKPFETIDTSGVARWKKIYELLEQCDVNDVITYDQIEEATDSFLDECRSDIYHAADKYLLEYKRSIECVRGVGYRVVAAREHERLIRQDVRSIRRKNRKAADRAIHVRRDELTTEQRRRIDEMQLHLAQHGEILRRMENKVRRLDEVYKILRSRTLENTEVTAEMSERMLRLEQRIAEMQSSTD
jgi:uncharacterized coiled-coil protein SlyX